MEPTQDQLPPDVSLDFRMTKDNLFCVWYESSPFQKSLGAPVFRHFWLLCDPALDLGPYLQNRAREMRVLGFLSLRDFETMESILSQKPSLFSFSRNLYFVEKNGKMFWAAKNEGTVLHRASPEALKDIIKKGRSIFNEKNYSEIFSDTRPVSDGHPKDWIRFMKDPAHALYMRAIDTSDLSDIKISENNPYVDK